MFLGIENVLDEDPRFSRRGRRTASTGGRRKGNATLDAIDVLHRNGMLVVGGLIVGNPDDTSESVAANLTFARAHVDATSASNAVSGTPMTREFLDRDLIVNRRVDDATDDRRHRGACAPGTPMRSNSCGGGRSAGRRSATWRRPSGTIQVRAAQRPAHVCAHVSRLDVALRDGAGDERAAFSRYHAIRRGERGYVDWPDPHPRPGHAGSRRAGAPRAAGFALRRHHSSTWLPSGSLGRQTSACRSSPAAASPCRRRLTPPRSPCPGSALRESARPSRQPAHQLDGWRSQSPWSWPSSPDPASCRS